jgi:hypothetical protein
MKKSPLLLVALLLLSGIARGQPEDPLQEFSKTLVPVMEGFETASIQKTLRGFLIRADSFPGFKDDKPTAYGMLLNLAVNDDPPAVIEKIDRTDTEDGCAHREIQLPGHFDGGSKMDVSFYYGASAPRDVVALINVELDELVRTHK